MRTNTTHAYTLACAAWMIAGCAEPGSHPAAPTDQSPTMAAKPGNPGAASDRIFYQAQLGALGGTRSHGIVLIEIVGGSLTVRVHAAGLEPGQPIPQHIHLFPTCAQGGAVLINLDANLTVPGEGAPIGAGYPVANQGGVVNYSASRSLTDLLGAVNTYAGAGLTSVDGLLAWLDLENRNAHMHVAFGPPFPAVNCGEVERLN